jgi:hypothetical protein
MAMKRWTHLPLALLLLAAACDDDDQPAVTPDAATGTPDTGAGVPDAGVGAPDGGAVDTGAPLIPLYDWVHDLVVGFGPMSAPDTVDDKNIMDTEDPAAFDSLLQ